MKGKKPFFITAVFILTLAIIFPVFANDCSTIAKAASIKINKSFLNLKAGETYTLKITGTKSKISWSSSNKEIASVSSKGKVTAKAIGTAIITAKIGSKKCTCRVTVEDSLTNEKAVKNITYVEAETDCGFVAIVTNENNVNVHAEIEVVFYDDNEKKLSSEKTSGFFGPGMKCAWLFPNPRDSSFNPIEYSSYQVNIKATIIQHDPFINHIDDIDLKVNEIYDNIEVTVTNKSDDILENVYIAAVFYQNGNIVGYSSGGLGNLSGGGSDMVNICRPFSPNLSEVILYDNYELYVNEAYARFE